METKTHAQKGVPKPHLQPFSKICEQEFKTLREGLYQIDWPARKDEVKEYIKKLNHYIHIKHFNKLAAKYIVEMLKDFLFLYKSITGGDLKMTRLPGEKDIHDAVKKLNKEIHRKVIKKEKTDGHNKVEVSSRKKICP